MLCHACGGALADTETVCLRCGASQGSRLGAGGRGAVEYFDYSRADSPFGIQYRFVQEDNLPYLDTATSSGDGLVIGYSEESYELSEATGED